MMSRFPEIEPYETGMLEVGDGHQVYWECSGNPAGKPALFLHGGPGSGCTPGQRRFFDPEAYRIVLFDQRGCGRWIVLGLSWGTTLGLAYAQAHPERVAGLVLALVTTTSRREVEWITEGVGRIFPAEWERFAAGVPERLRTMPLVDAYATLLADPDPTVQAAAARRWCAWEDAHVSLTPGHQPSPRYADPAFRLRFARLVTHYWQHAAFLEEEQLLRDAARLNGIPGVLIHGRYDVSSPLETAWKLSRSWETSRLHVLAEAGHGGGDSLLQAIIAALHDLEAGGHGPASCR